jgi:hypothetical protein
MDLPEIVVNDVHERMPAAPQHCPIHFSGKRNTRRLSDYLDHLILFHSPAVTQRKIDKYGCVLLQNVLGGLEHNAPFAVINQVVSSQNKTFRILKIISSEY